MWRGSIRNERIREADLSDDEDREPGELLESVPSDEENRRTDRTDDGGRVGQVLMFHALRDED